MKPLVVMPAHNEAANIAAVLDEIRAFHPQLDIVVVDDGSADDTAARAAAGGCAVVRLPFNLGYGGAVQTGLLYALRHGYDVGILLDSDGQHDPRSIAPLLAAVADRTTDLALGSRFLGEAAYKVPRQRRIGIYLFSRVASLLIGQPITDPTSGFQAMNRRVMEFCSGDHYPTDYPDADTLIRLHLAGFRIQEVPVTIRPRLRGVSMHGGARTFYYLYKMLLSIFVTLTQRTMLAQEGKACR